MLNNYKTTHYFCPANISSKLPGLDSVSVSAVSQSNPDLEMNEIKLFE